jgi:hypothetical protein
MESSFKLHQTELMHHYQVLRCCSLQDLRSHKAKADRESLARQGGPEISRGRLPSPLSTASVNSQEQERVRAWPRHKEACPESWFLDRDVLKKLLLEILAPHSHAFHVSLAATELLRQVSQAQDTKAAVNSATRNLRACLVTFFF